MNWLKYLSFYLQAVMFVVLPKALKKVLHQCIGKRYANVRTILVSTVIRPLHLDFFNVFKKKRAAGAPEKTEKSIEIVTYIREIGVVRLQNLVQCKVEDVQQIELVKLRDLFGLENECVKAVKIIFVCPKLESLSTLLLIKFCGRR